MGALLRAFPKQIFRAYDIRGDLTVFTPQMVQAIAYGLVEQYRLVEQSTVVLAYDARLSSPMYALIIQDIFKKNGLNTIMIGCCSSPMLYFIARQYQGNGVMVTASHNSKSDNGLKWIVQNQPPSPDQIAAVATLAQQYYFLLEEQPLALLLHQHDEYFCEQYQRALLTDIQLGASVKVVLDGLHGSAGSCAKTILTRLGCEVIALRCEPNGHFPDHAPDPSQEKHLEKLKQKVLEYQANIGIALDGDGDRLVLVDEQGKVITADRLLCLFAEMCLSQAKHPAEIVFDVKCSTMVRNTIRELSGQAVMIRTGSTFLKRYMTQSEGKAIFGGEYAGHYVFNDGRGYGYDDALYAALRVLEYLQMQQKTLSQALTPYPERFGTEDLYISTHGFEIHEVLGKVKAESQVIHADCCEIDGIRLDFDDGFGIIRASNTGDNFTLRFDASSAQRLNEIRNLFVSWLQDYPAIAQDILAAQ